jgi:hypothetical protein
MVSLMTRLKKDLQEATEVDRFTRRLIKLEKEVERIEKLLQELDKEVGSVSRKTAALTSKGGQKRKPLIDQIEEIVKEQGGGPMKVTDVKDILLKDKNVKTRAKNFYAVITVSLNNSNKFEKTGPGEYRLLPEASRAAAAKKGPAKKKAAAEKTAAKKAPAKKKAVAAKKPAARKTRAAKK